MKRPVQHQDKHKLSPEMKKKLDNIIDEYSDIFIKDQYDIGTSIWEVLLLFDSEAVAWVSGAAETVNYFC